MGRQGTGRLDAAAEQQLAQRIGEEEREAMRALGDLPEAMAVLRAPVSRVYRTRAVGVERLEQAIDVAAAKEAERPELAPRVAAARQAWNRAQALRWQLAMSAAHVVPAEARKVAHASRMDPEDLESEGYIGLLRAATRFEPERGVRFATYARWWARAQMTRAVDGGGRDIRLSGAAVEQLRHLRQVDERFRRTQRRPTLEDLARETGYDPKRIQELLQHPQVLSLDASLDGDSPGDGRVVDLVPAELDPADDRAADRQAQVVLKRGLAALEERLRTVLVLRYGLEGQTPHRLREIGDQLGLSRERVRQLEHQALRQLREACGIGLDEVVTQAA